MVKTRYYSYMHCFWGYLLMSYPTANGTDNIINLTTFSVTGDKAEDFSIVLDPAIQHIMK